MTRLFSYGRTSTADQTTDNQALQIKTAGFDVIPSRRITEIISGTVPASKRPAFSALLIKLEEGDSLIVTRIDRLGRDTANVLSTVDLLKSKGVRLVSLDLGGLDLTSSSGAMVLTVLAAVAAMERAVLVERTHAGLARALKAGKTLGRKPTLKPAQVDKIRTALAAGGTISGLSRDLGVSRATVMRAGKQ